MPVKGCVRETLGVFDGVVPGDSCPWCRCDICHARRLPTQAIRLPFLTLTSPRATRHSKAVNAYVLVDAIVQQTMVFIAQLATAGGVRAPLAHVAEQVFLDLTNELQNRGVRKNVIADMFGMALRTYHRRVRELSESKTESGKSVWEAVLGFIRQHEPVSGTEVLQRFAGDDPDVISGVLGDLAQSGLVYRAGRGDSARYRIAAEADFSNDDGTLVEAHEHLVWLAAYRNGPVTEEGIRSWTRLSKEACATPLLRLVKDGRVRQTRSGGEMMYSADRFEVPVGATNGWEAAILDHFQAMVSAIIAKLGQRSARGTAGDLVGGSTWSLDVWPGHPFEQEAKTLLRRTRTVLEELRARIDDHNRTVSHPGAIERVVFYAGQNVREGNAAFFGGGHDRENDESVE